VVTVHPQDNKTLQPHEDTVWSSAQIFMIQTEGKRSSRRRKGSSERCWGYKCVSRTGDTHLLLVSFSTPWTLIQDNPEISSREQKNTNEQFGIETFGDSGSVSAVMHGKWKWNEQNENILYSKYGYIVKTVSNQHKFFCPT